MNLNYSLPERSTQHFFLMAEYLSERLLLTMQTRMSGCCLLNTSSMALM